jgi:antitoxin VapB
MASLYIKDPETAELAARVARRRGVTKTEAVRDALRKAEAQIEDLSSKSREAWLEDYKRRFPALTRAGPAADKAFFDRLWGEE